MKPSSTNSLATPVWQLAGIFNYPGLLELHGRLALTIGDERLFDVPLDHLSDVIFPWYYLGGAVRLTVADTRYRLSFVRPNDPLHIAKGRAAGKAWKAILIAQP
jgi:hypothetical protein